MSKSTKTQPTKIQPTKIQPAFEWGTKVQVLARYGIPRRKLLEFYEKGFIRSVKCGVGIKSRRLYCAADIDAALKQLAIGRQPRKRRS